MCCILLTFLVVFLTQGNGMDTLFFFHSSVWDFRGSWLCFCHDFLFSPDKWASTSLLLVHRVENMKITSSIESRLLSLCVTAWCGCGVVLYVYMCFHTCRCVCVYVCVFIYMYVCVIYTLWYIHTPMWTQQILYCFGTKYTTILGVCL